MLGPFLIPTLSSRSCRPRHMSKRSLRRQNLNRITPADCRSNGLAKTPQHRVSPTWRRPPLSIARLGIENQPIVSNAKRRRRSGETYRLRATRHAMQLQTRVVRPCNAVHTDNNRNCRPKRLPIYHASQLQDNWKTFHPLPCWFPTTSGTYMCCFIPGMIVVEFPYTLPSPYFNPCLNSSISPHAIPFAQIQYVRNWFSSIPACLLALHLSINICVAWCQTCFKSVQKKILGLTARVDVLPPLQTCPRQTFDILESRFVGGRSCSYRISLCRYP
jgi:hypothetical protein